MGWDHYRKVWAKVKKPLGASRTPGGVSKVEGEGSAAFEAALAAQK